MDGGEEWMRATEAERRPLYAAAADIQIDTDWRKPPAIADKLMARLRERCPELSELSG